MPEPGGPRVLAGQAAGIASALYGLDGRAERLAAEHDDTFRLVTADGAARLLKISLDGAPGRQGTPGREAGGDQADELASLPTAVLLHLAAVAPGLPVQRVVALPDGRPEARITAGGRSRLVRMTSWLDGELLGGRAQAGGPGGAALRRETGATLARLDLALRGFRHPGARRTHWWDLQQFGRLEGLLAELPASGLLPEVAQAVPGGAGSLRGALEECLERFAAVVQPRLAAAPVQLIHADFHGENLLTDGSRITGILDFGDALSGPAAMDAGIAACYQLGAGPGWPGPDVLGPALDVVAGYHAAGPLLPASGLELAAEFLTLRVATRVVVSQYNALREPANRGYLLRRTPQAASQLMALRRLGPDQVTALLRAACGYR